MLASLREAALAAGHPEWGHGGPHDSGHYNSHSSETGFFKSYGGSWDSGAWAGSSAGRAGAAAGWGRVCRDACRLPGAVPPPCCLAQLRSAAPAADYGRFFLNWYSGLLIQHADRLLGAARQVTSGLVVHAPLLWCCAHRQAGALLLGRCCCRKLARVSPHALMLAPACLQVLSARCRPRTMREARELSDGGMLYVFEPAVQLGIKLAGVHWCDAVGWAAGLPLHLHLLPLSPHAQAGGMVADLPTTAAPPAFCQVVQVACARRGADCRLLQHAGAQRLPAHL